MGCAMVPGSTLCKIQFFSKWQCNIRRGVHSEITPSYVLFWKPSLDIDFFHKCQSLNLLSLLESLSSMSPEEYAHKETHTNANTHPSIFQQACWDLQKKKDTQKQKTI